MARDIPADLDHAANRVRDPLKPTVFDSLFFPLENLGYIYPSIAI